ncbi:anhydro-N-acetylmuramic acid kinase [Rhodoferax sp.]|uniref:anhydro-N-acetylmuramic acid kinase n=1 Tax=Rhodoferax sp. TaxID=50421 RepID=UPI00283D4312|nr:anhydro-N-acetylmuramic acid kinase [Rhodoferax sp.]MDR3372038.1 anhydro-N-acetylmuramic acid kinase [Rhodoferax sp.]
MAEYYIGLMSGTSLDGVDGVLVDFSGSTLQVLAQASMPFDAVFKAELLALNSPSHNELHRAAQVGNQIAAAYAQVASDLCQQANSLGVDAVDILAIGAHGQTVRHQPHRVSDAAHGAGYTLQLGNPALLAELTGITVVADFRSRDVAAGGQGAPLVPAFHRHVFAQADAMVAVLNLGGIANLSVLPANAASPVLGFDCGPGNVLMDAWCLKHTGQPYDTAGAWAASGRCLPDLLTLLQSEPYFVQPPPKSTGRDLFSLTWLTDKLRDFSAARPQDIQNTLTELTASSCVQSVTSYANDSKSLVVSGGGAFNDYLMQRLQEGLPGVLVSTSDQHGLPPLEVEAAAFAWLARQTMRHLPGNLPSVTGAAGLRILGAIYPA